MIFKAIEAPVDKILHTFAKRGKEAAMANVDMTMVTGESIYIGFIICSSFNVMILIE
jgi:hypothetical protein